jgi:hypothetical protein
MLLALTTGKQALITLTVLWFVVLPKQRRIIRVPVIVSIALLIISVSLIIYNSQFQHIVTQNQNPAEYFLLAESGALGRVVAAEAFLHLELTVGGRVMVHKG